MINIDGSDGCESSPSSIKFESTFETHQRVRGIILYLGDVQPPSPTPSATWIWARKNSPGSKCVVRSTLSRSHRREPFLIAATQVPFKTLISMALSTFKCRFLKAARERRFVLLDSAQGIHNDGHRSLGTTPIEVDIYFNRSSRA